MNELITLLKDTKKHLMTGVSYMIPFVVAGGILLAVSVLLSGKAAVPDAGALKGFAEIGIVGLVLMVPILSGYIAFSMADRPAIAPGMIGGMVASNIGAGFIGGIISGILAGITIFYLKKIKLPSSLRSLMPIFVLPLLGTLIVGGLMYFVIGEPISVAMKNMTDYLNTLGTGNLAFLGLILGAMIAFDMGGPVNKVAFSFGVAMVGTIEASTGLPSTTALNIMAAIGVAICTPPIAMGIATLIAPKKFTQTEQNAGKAAIVMGCVGITEGAIPFAAEDPVRVIPANVIGGAIGAAVSIILAAGNPASWGGLIVVPVVVNPISYIIAVLVGAAVTAGIVIALKKDAQLEQASTSSASDDDIDLKIEIS